MPDNKIVKVLGTHFNVQHYDNEPAHEVTLLEGSVEVDAGNSKQRLSPGEQLRISNNTFELLQNIDVEAVTGWRNNRFVFHDASINTIMREISRWYNIEVIYDAPVSELFNATISRDEPLSRLLKLLEQTGKVAFKTENNRIYVLR